MSKYRYSWDGMSCDKIFSGAAQWMDPPVQAVSQENSQISGSMLDNLKSARQALPSPTTSMF